MVEPGSGSVTEPQPKAETLTSRPPPPGARGWRRGALPAAALIVGLLIGGGVGAVAASSDPTKSSEYRALEQKLAAADSQAAVEKHNAEAAQSAAAETAAAAQSAQAEVAASQSALAEQAQAVASREAAVSATEKQVEANSIGEGTWTVGTDIRAGSYQTSAAVSGDCYWSITKSGTNGSDIIENDIPSGGFPSVVLRAGQDFTNHGCGTFVKR
jgi:gas vesicle protein